jgi:hypothetical protein
LPYRFSRDSDTKPAVPNQLKQYAPGLADTPKQRLLYKTNPDDSYNLSFLPGEKQPLEEVKTFVNAVLLIRGSLFRISIKDFDFH